MSRLYPCSHRDFKPNFCAANMCKNLYLYVNALVCKAHQEHMYASNKNSNNETLIYIYVQRQGQSSTRQCSLGAWRFLSKLYCGTHEYLPQSTPRFHSKPTCVFTFKLVSRSAVSTRTTRSSQLLNIPLFRTASVQKTFQYRATSLWNELQPALKLSPSVTDFKRLLRRKNLNDCSV